MKKNKSHLNGGSLRRVMAIEVIRCLQKHSKESSRVIDFAALELGITPRTLRLWLGPVEKGGWEELQVSMEEALKKLNDVIKFDKRAMANRRTRREHKFED